jgi:hypothetical protein
MSLVGFKAGNHPQQTDKRGARDDVDDRGTDQAFFDSLTERFGRFTLDVAAAPHNAKCDTFLTIEDDGLSVPWGRPCVMCNGKGNDFRDVMGEPDAVGIREVVSRYGIDAPCRACQGRARERVWCNPPYSDCGAWVQKAWQEWRSEDRPDLIVMLLPANRVEQGWWQDHVEPFRDKPGSPLRVEFLRGRMRFDRPGWTPGRKGDRPPFGCCLLIWDAS